MGEVKISDWLFNCIVPTGIAKELQTIAECFFPCNSGANIDISGKNPEKNVVVYTPYDLAIDSCWFVIDGSRKLIIKTSKGWQRTDITIYTH